MSAQSRQTQVNARYQLHDQLGAGAMGVVYRATDRLTGQTVALKRVTLASSQLEFASRASVGESGNVRLALAQEFRTLSSLRHPHIISVLDYGFDTDRQPYFTMDLLEGAHTLLEAGETQPLEIQVNLLIQVLQALAYLHRRGILHRDLKPANVLVNAQGQAKVLDFGLSAAVEQAKGIAGTLAYMAPEVVQNKPVSQASDLYAVGMMAYQLFTGTYPFNLRSPARLMAHIVALEPDVSSIDNPELAAVVTRLLAKAPAARYADADAVIRELSAAIEQEPPQENAVIRESFLQAAQFIGRETEFAQLTDALQNALHGQGSAWLVGGESGVGKSRLVDELRTQALVEGATVLRGQAVEGGGLPYQLWRDAARRLALSTELNDLEAGVLKEIVPDIGQLLGRDVPDAPELTGAAGQQRLTFTLADVLKRQTQPVVLIVEDLQWAAESLAALKHLTEIVQSLPLLIVGNYRSDERPDLPEELPQMQVMPLPRLDEDSITQLSVSMLGEGGRQPQVVELLQKETEGNVFFLVEVVRALAEEAGQLSAVGLMTLPESVFAGGIQRIVQRRLNKVPADLQPLSELAAVLGREVDRAVLRQIAPAEQVETWLTACANAAVLDVQDDRWRFAHDKLREALVASLSDADRPALHRQVAEAIEAAYPADDAYAARLVRHWHEAGDEDKEWHYTRIAAEQSREISDYRETRRLLERALAITPPEDAATQALLSDRIGVVCEQLGDYPTAAQYHERALTLSRAIGDQQTEVSALNGLSLVFLRQGQLERAREHAERARALAEASGDRKSLATSLTRLGMIDYQVRNNASSRQYYQQALAMLEEIQETWKQHAVAMLLSNLIDVYNRLGDHERAQRYFEEGLALSRQLGNRSGICVNLANWGVGLLNRGETEAAAPYLEEALAIAKEIGYLEAVSRLLSLLGSVVQDRRDYAAAQQYYEEAIALQRKIGNAYFLRELEYLGYLHILRGQYDAAVRAFEEKLAGNRALNDQRGAAYALDGLGVVHMLRGDYDSAVRCHEASLTEHRACQYQMGITVSLSHLGTVAAVRGDVETARRYCRDALSTLPALTEAVAFTTLKVLTAVASLLARQAAHERAVELTGFILDHPAYFSAKRYLLEPLLANLGEKMPAADLEAALERGKMLDVETVAAETLAALEGEVDDRH